jgi:hypothetical protein
MVFDDKTITSTTKIPNVFKEKFVLKVSVNCSNITVSPAVASPNYNLVNQKIF